MSKADQIMEACKIDEKDKGVSAVVDAKQAAAVIDWALKNTFFRDKEGTDDAAQDALKEKDGAAMVSALKKTADDTALAFASKEKNGYFEIVHYKGEGFGLLVPSDETVRQIRKAVPGIDLDG